MPIDKFDSMIATCYRFIEDNRKIIEEHDCYDLETVQHLFRNMHTMKGLARSYELRSLSEAAHIAEEFYSESLQSEEWNKESMLEELNKAQAIISSYKVVNKEKLGRSSKDTKKIEVDREIVENNLQRLSKYEILELIY